MSGATPNAALEAQLLVLAQQSPTGLVDAMALRAALAQKPDALDALNAAAAAGTLKGVAIDRNAATATAVGSFDASSGVLSLPASAWASPATLQGPIAVQGMLFTFGAQPGVTPDMRRNLQDTINSSPPLVQQLQLAVDQGHLRRFDLLAGTVAGGTYDGQNKVMNLPASALQTPPGGTFDANDLTFVLGHEVQHGFNHAARVAGYARFESELKAIAGDANPKNDYTAPIARMLQDGRDDEARAHIAGWNALHGRAVASGSLTGDPMLDTYKKQSGRGDDFLVKDPASKAMVPRPGLTFEPDGSLQPTPANVAAMGRYYFDQVPKNTPNVAAQDTVGIGFHGDSDYSNYYAAYGIGRAAHYERTVSVPKHGAASEFQIDLAALRLEERLIERNGLRLDAANPTARQPYVDIGASPPRVGNFDHTEGVNQHVPVHAHAESPVPEAPSRVGGAGALGERDRALHDRIAALGRAQGLDAERAANLAAAGVVAMKENPLVSRVDDLRIAGDRLFIVHMPHGPEKHPMHYTSVEVDAAARRPADESLQRALQLDQQQAASLAYEAAQQFPSRAAHALH